VHEEPALHEVERHEPRAAPGVQNACTGGDVLRDGVDGELPALGQHPVVHAAGLHVEVLPVGCVAAEVRLDPIELRACGGRCPALA
jgi:hypothetical protein